MAGAPIRREHFDAQTGPTGAFLIGDPEEVAEKIVRHSKASGWHFTTYISNG